MKIKKQLFIAFYLIYSNVAHTQVGINTTSPAIGSVLDLTATNKALLITRVANTAAISNPENGMMIYDLSTNCFKLYENGLWSSCFSAGTGFFGTISSINCSTPTNNGTLSQGSSSTGVDSIISYTGGNGGTYTSQSVTSTGVTGLTATLTAGTFASGNGSLTYNITGTPNSGGIASFILNIGGQSCTLSRSVAFNITIPNTITLAPNRNCFVVSSFDQDYLPYTLPSSAATTNAQAADGSNEAITINIQGSITTTGVSARIPVTATASGTIPAYSTTITIPAYMTEDGISRNLTLSWPTQNYTLTTTQISAGIKAVGGTLNAKKLDFNTGIGNDLLGVLMGQFNYPYNNAGNAATYTVRDISAVPDKMFGLPQNTTDNLTNTHMMLYLPVTAEDGKIWLNNNLGAHYSNINHPSFNPAQQAVATNDHLAYGSSFQWGRKPDGHELITYTSATTGTALNSTNPTNSDFPSDALFITETVSPNDWRVNHDNSLWSEETSPNNPCPLGFKVPGAGEVNNLFSPSKANITNSSAALNSALKFTETGGRNVGNGSFTYVGGLGIYWNNLISGNFSSIRYFGSNVSTTDLNPEEILMQYVASKINYKLMEGRNFLYNILQMLKNLTVRN